MTPPLPPNSEFFTNDDTYGPCFKLYDGYCNPETGVGPKLQLFPLSAMDEQPECQYVKKLASAAGRAAWADAEFDDDNPLWNRWAVDQGLRWRSIADWNMFIQRCADHWRVWGNAKPCPVA